MRASLMRWLFSFLYEYITMPRESGGDANETRSMRSKILVGVLVMSLALNGWIGWRLVGLGRSHINAIRHIKELELQVNEKTECSTKLKEAQIYLKMCMAPGRR